MQRQLLKIADKVPDEILLTLLKSFAQLLSHEPATKAPFIRAFAKIRDEKQFSAIVEEDEEQLKYYESSNSEEENECTFNYKVSTQQIIYNVGENNQEKEVLPTSEENNNQEVFEEIFRDLESDTIENIDEGIEMEMPKLLPSDEVANENTSEQTKENEEFENEAELIEEIVETPIEEIIVEEEEEIILEPIPQEAPMVSLDDIEREIQEMQNFLLFKGIKPDKKIKKASTENESKEKELDDSMNIEDAYKLDVCIKLKNRHGDSHHKHKKHHHSKYLRSENYQEEIIDSGPIFDPAVPNTQEDFMKVKSGSGRIDRKKEKAQALDVCWEKLCSSDKKLYRLFNVIL